ncbi:MAG: hypothetical protein QME81_11015 [bacterium]|nr:hypothetical protein [bacterium]
MEILITQTISQKVEKIKQIEDIVALNSYVDFLIYKEEHTQSTELGQDIIQGLKEVMEGKTYKITSAEDILKVPDNEI